MTERNRMERCAEHQEMINNVRKLEGNTLHIAITSTETAKAVELIKTNHLPHIQAAVDVLREELAMKCKILFWVWGFGIALIAVLIVLQ